MPADPPVPPELAPYAWLIGTWVGVGVGGYPTIDDFRFAQEMVFATDGRPFLAYHSRSWLLDDDGERVRPTGTESGFWRPRPDNGLEVLLAHPTGFAEVWVGRQQVTAIQDARVTRAAIELRTDVVARTESAKEVSAGVRMYGLVEGGDLAWVYEMAAVGQPITPHLSARLARVDGG